MTLVQEKDNATVSLPLVLDFAPGLNLSDEQLLKLSAQNRDLRFERTALGELIVMAPTGGESGRKEADIIAQLTVWAKQDGGGQSFSSSTGFRLANGAVRSPDACWVANERLAGLSAEDWKKYLVLCPDFVIELRSATDSLVVLQEKMTEYLENGARLGWLLDPQDNKAYVYTAKGVELMDGPKELCGDPVLVEFCLDLAEIF